ncbi:MAG: hypothetical protein RJQ07_03940 [Pseudomonadales bacterium]
MARAQPPARAIIRPDSRLRGVNAARAAGFTVVELITTIILLAILSGFAMTRLVKPTSFAPSTFAHQLDLELSLAQSLATARQDAALTFALSLAADGYVLTTRNSVDGVVRTTTLDADSLTLMATAGATSIQLSTTDALEITFAGDGTVSDLNLGGSLVSGNAGLDINIAGETSRSLCLHPTGYLDAAPCS